MKIYAISDTHFGHEKLVEYGRPEGFTATILNNLEKAQGDLLIHCGDFCIGRDEHWHKLFMDATRHFKKKVLVRGNHDSKSNSWYYDHGWDFVCDNFSLKHNGKNLIFTHIPVDETEFKMHIDKNVHGHMHGNNHRDYELGKDRALTDFHFDLAPEIRNYRSVNIDDICR